MTENKAQEHDKKQELRESVFAKEKTFGEKRYDLIFGNLTNFWVNLLASAGFAFWVRHSKEVKVPFSEKTFTPSDIQNKFANWIEKTFSMNDHEKAGSIANIMTLLTPGHLVMIPSVYFGEKYKAGIVKHFNRKHYGEEAMQSDELRARHAQIEHAEKPTLWGTVVARAGTAVINSTVTYAVGTENNLIHQLGEKHGIESLQNFKGLDHITDRIGIGAGKAVEATAPKLFEHLNKPLSHNMQYSSEQIARATKHPTDADPNLAKITDGKPYNSGFNNLLRYISQDVIYTVIAAGVVHPIINVLKHVVPGMTYKPKHIKNPTPVDEPVKVKSYHFDETQIAQVPSAIKASEQPSPSVSNIQNEATIIKRDELAVAPIGA